MRIRGKASSHSFCAAIEQGDSIKSPEVAIPTKEEKEKGSSSSSSSSKKACDDENGVETSDFSCRILHVASSQVLIEEEIHTEPPIVIATFPLPHFLKKQSNEPEQSTKKQSNEPEQSTKKQSNEPEPSTKKQSNEPEQSKKRQRFEHESNEEVPLFFTVRRKRTPRIEVKRIKNNNYYMEEQVELQQPELPVNNNNNNMESQNELQQPELLVNNNKNNNNMGHEQNELQPPELPVNNNNNNMEEQNELQPPELPVNNNNNNMGNEQNDPDQPELPVNNNNNMGHEQNDPGQPELPVNNNNNMEQEHNDPDQPVLPIEVQEKIQELGGSEVKLVIQKKLHKSDVNAGHNRFSIPSQQILARDFLTQEEVTLLNGREGGKPAGLTVNVLDPSLELWEGLRLKKWEMTSSPTYNIISGWMKVVKNSGLEPEDVVQLWSFRSNGQLNFALVKL